MIRVSKFLAVILLIAAGAFAQDFPFPTPYGTLNPPVCTVCPAPSTGLPAAQFATPIKAFTGRYLDSSFNRDVQGPYRTIRARTIRFVPESDRIYMVIGSTFARPPRG